MFFFDVFHFDRSKQLSCACSSGVLCVRPVQAQRPTVHPAAHPSDEGSGSACRHQRSGQPHHGVAKPGSQPHLCRMNHHDSRSSVLAAAQWDTLPKLGHQSDFCFYLRFSGVNREGEFYPPSKHCRRLKANQEAEAEVALLASVCFQHPEPRQRSSSPPPIEPGGFFKDPFPSKQDDVFIVWVWTRNSFSPLE